MLDASSASLTASQKPNTHFFAVKILLTFTKYVGISIDISVDGCAIFILYKPYFGTVRKQGGFIPRAEAHGVFAREQFIIKV